MSLSNPRAKLPASDGDYMHTFTVGGDGEGASCPVLLPSWLVARVSMGGSKPPVSCDSFVFCIGGFRFCRIIRHPAME